MKYIPVIAVAASDLRADKRDQRADAFVRGRLRNGIERRCGYVQRHQTFALANIALEISATSSSGYSGVPSGTSTSARFMVAVAFIGEDFL